MEAKKLRIIIDELSKFCGMVQEEEVQKLADEVKTANKIFLAGAGRSGLAARGFTNRLLHMGFDVHFVGEISCPPIKEEDLIILGSESKRCGSKDRNCNNVPRAYDRTDGRRDRNSSRINT